MTHTKSVAVRKPVRGNLTEVAVAIASVGVETGKVADNGKIEKSVAVEIHEGSAQRPAVPLDP
jgi:hypothetical protein